MASDSELWWNKYYQGNTKKYLDALLEQNNPQGTKSLEINQRQIYERFPTQIKWNEEQERSGTAYGGAVLDYFTPPQTLPPEYGGQYVADSVPVTVEPITPVTTVQPQQEHIITISAVTNQIISDITAGVLQVPDWFHNNINYVKNGQLNENDFLTSFHNLVDQDIIHEAHAEPEPEPENILSVNAKISFTDTNIGGFSTSIPVNDAHQAMLLASKSPKWQWTFIGGSTNSPLTSLNDLLNTINNLLVIPTPEPEPEPEPNLSYITDNMITQKVNYFSIIDGRAKGEITFTITDSFNPYYFNKNIVNLIQFKTPNGINILPTVKQNTLRFTQTERDENIQFDEDMQGNTRVIVESFVWDSTLSQSFSKVSSIEISATEPPTIAGKSGIMGAGVAGAIGILILLGFVADSRRNK